MGAGWGWVRGAEGMGASAGGSAWVCPFKRRCLFSSFGTQPLSCLRLQRQRIKGLFYLNETLSPASPVDAGAGIPLDSASMPGVHHRAEGVCWGGGAGEKWVLRGERCLAKSGDVAAPVGWLLDGGWL